MWCLGRMAHERAIGPRFEEAVLTRFAVLVAMLCAPLVGQAQSWGDGSLSTPRFEQCLPVQMVAFEQVLDGAAYGWDWQRSAMNSHWVQHCGYLAIGICDVSDRTFNCQRRLREAWDAQSADLRAGLPAPGDADGLLLSPLYAQAFALAQGRDAGDDCAGWDYRRQVWCRAFREALRLEAAVHAWQVARLMGIVGPLDWVALSDLE